MKHMRMGALVVLLALAAATPLASQMSDAADAAVTIAATYRVVPNITYHVADGYESKLDVYVPRGAGPHPTLIQIHGGGWVGGTKEGKSLRLLPYLEMGWAVVNDGLCALRWTIRNAADFNLDTERIVVTGYSAGGHLALTTGVVPASAGLDRQCPGNEVLEVAAIVNWYGITDVGDLLDGPNMRTYAVEWLGSLPNRYEVAERASPLTYVRPGLPPVLTIHGDADPVVPYSHAIRLQEALSQAGVANQLHTVPGGGHGGFTVDEYLEAYSVLRDFLEEHVPGWTTP
jgi:acetyl esterase/lipase